MKVRDTFWLHVRLAKKGWKQKGIRPLTSSSLTMAFAPLHLREIEKTKVVSMISTIPIVADASKEALDLVLEAFQRLRKGQLEIRGFFISCLSEPFLKHLDPNILSILLKDEVGTLEIGEYYFDHMNIAHHFELISPRHWQTVFEEVKVGDLDLIILQGEFLKIFREKNVIRESRLHAVTSKCPVLIINESEKPSSTFYF